MHIHNSGLLPPRRRLVYAAYKLKLRLFVAFLRGLEQTNGPRKGDRLGWPLARLQD